MEENDVKKTILDDNPVPEIMGGPKVIDDYLKEMLWEAKKSKELEQGQSLENIQQKVLNIMEPVSKLWVGVDEVKCSGKSWQMSLQDLPTAIDQTGVLVGQASQSITYYHRHNVLTSLLQNPQKSTSILKEKSDSLVQNSTKLFGPKLEEHLNKKAKLKTESKKVLSKVSYSKPGNSKSFSIRIFI